MSGYHPFEQTIGAILSRFPRAKRAIETTYQRANYHLFVDRSFEYALHDEVSMYSAAEWYGLSEQPLDRFVGFFDVCPWNQSMSHVACHEVTTPEADARIGLLGTDGYRQLDRTSAWNYQQGSRLQWYPHAENAVIFNDIAEGKQIARVVTQHGKDLAQYRWPVQAVNPVRNEFISLDYDRLSACSPGYGYLPVDRDPGALATGTSANRDFDGLLLVTETETATELVTFRELATRAGLESHRGQHVHHVVFNPDGDRIAFLHRWQEDSGEQTQLILCDRAGNFECLLTNPALSHFCWLDDGCLLFWGATDSHGTGYHRYHISNNRSEPISSVAGYGDGHPAATPRHDWIAIDNYPDRTRKQTLSLLHPPTQAVVQIAQFIAPFDYSGRQRCDLHPRWSPDGNLLSIDSAHTGNRDTYVVDVSQVID